MQIVSEVQRFTVIVIKLTAVFSAFPSYSELWEYATKTEIFIDDCKCQFVMRICYIEHGVVFYVPSNTV